MLVTIHNFPSHMRYSDIRSLLQSKCGFTEVILDNLVNEGTTKKVTVGLAEEEDAAILTRNINGLYVEGKQLYVKDVRQKKATEQPFYSRNSLNTQNMGNMAQKELSYQPLLSNQLQVGYQPSGNYQGQSGFPMPMNQQPGISQFGSQPVMSQEAVMPVMPPEMMGGWNGMYFMQPQNSFMDYTGQGQVAAAASQFSQYPGQQNQMMGTGNGSDSSRFQENTPRRWNPENSANNEDVQGSRGKQDNSRGRQSSRWGGDKRDGGEKRNRSRSPRFQEKRLSSPKRSKYDDQYHRDQPQGKNYQSSQRQDYEISNSIRENDESIAAINAKLLSLSNNAPSLGWDWDRRSPPPQEQPKAQNNHWRQRENNPVETNRQSHNNWGPSASTALLKTPANNTPWASKKAPLLGDHPKPRDSWNRSNPNYLAQSESGRNRANPNSYNPNYLAQSESGRNRANPNSFGPPESGRNRPNPNAFGPSESGRNRSNDIQSKGPSQRSSRSDEFQSQRSVRPLGPQAERPFRPRADWVPAKQRRAEAAQQSGQNAAAVKPAQQPPKSGPTVPRPADASRFTQAAMIRRDTSFRLEASAHLVKSMLTENLIKKLPVKYLSETNGRMAIKTCFLKAIKKAVSSRLEVVLADSLGITKEEMSRRYRKKFPPHQNLEFVRHILEITPFEQRKATEPGEGEVKEKPADKLGANSAPPAMGTAAAKKQGAGPAQNGQGLKSLNVPMLAPAQGKVPSNPNADKQIYKQLKQVQKAERDGDENFYRDDMLAKFPREEAALRQQAELIADMVKQELSNPLEHLHKPACDKVMRNGAVEAVRKAVILNVSKRILDVRSNLQIRIMMNGGKAPKADVEQFLKQYGVVSLKKPTRSRIPYFVCTLSSYQAYDKLLNMGHQQINPHITLVFKPLNLFGPKLSFRERQNQRRKALENPGEYYEMTVALQTADVKSEDFKKEEVIEDFKKEEVIEDFMEEGVIEDFMEEEVIDDFDFTADVGAPDAENIIDQMKDQPVEDYDDEPINEEDFEEY